MGLCTSCDASAVGQPSTTAKLILADGSLREFDRPVLVASVLAGKSDRWFVCDADEMEFDRYVSAVGSDEWLRPGQIYFVLPTSMLKTPLPADDLAKLAVKASAALMKNPAPCGKRIYVAPLVLEPKEVGKAVVPTVSERRRRRKTRSDSGAGRRFASDLSSIPE